MIYFIFSGIFLVFALASVIGILAYLEKIVSMQIKQSKESANSIELYDLKEQLISIGQFRRVILICTLVLAGGGLLYFLINGALMQGFVMEWLNLLIRWVHVVVGIMWIGASFYFIFLENNLNRTDNVRDELAGNLWAIHGGGFYYLEKYKLAPQKQPKKLHWFKYEAYFTWLSGFSLLCIVYYMDAKAFLIDPQVADISTSTGILIGIGTMVIGWIVYDRMCKSPLVKNNILFAIIGFMLLVAVSYFLSHVFNPRAAYIHVGALIGTLMAWNVYFVIIPAQKSLVRAAVTGQPLDPSLGKKAGERSLHNNYLTLPVIFIMISNHFPSTFGHEYNWLVLMVITLASAGIKHFWNLHERGVKNQWILPVSLLALISLALVTSPILDKVDKNAKTVTYEEVKGIITLRCIQCHSANPTDEQWTSAPNGVMYDTPEQVQAMKDKIMLRAVQTNSMPQGNKTNMTQEERDIIKAWIVQGAKIN
jgi:uncharacterized membrane protein